MRLSTIPRLKCAATKKCGGDLELMESQSLDCPLERSGDEIHYGNLLCKKCKTRFPVLAGVAIVVPDIEGYFVHHAKGISKFVPDQKIPKAFRLAYLQAKKQVVDAYQEEDLESDRVNALYLMNHYLSAKGPVEWWKPSPDPFDPLMDSLIRTHWDHGPFAVIAGWLHALKNQSVVELGCGVGGLYRKISMSADSYLGVDSSFQSILLARHLNLGAPYGRDLKIPSDLYRGGISRSIEFLKTSAVQESPVDFLVGVIDLLPLKKNQFDISISMNTLDMLADPRTLPDVQYQLLKHAGVALQCGPYIWHEKVAKRLRSQLPKEIQNSAKAVEAIYQKAGFKIKEVKDFVPWLFFKHARQLELYSVHAIFAKKI